VLLRLAYLGVANALAMLRLLPMSDRAKDAEILALRHQIAVLERHLHGQKVRFSPADRAVLAALLHREGCNLADRVLVGMLLWPSGGLGGFLAWRARRVRRVVALGPEGSRSTSATEADVGVEGHAVGKVVGPPIA
jgi:hypothetical protein